MDKVWTYRDLKHTPDDGRRYEILDGELVVSPAPGTPHQRASFDLALALHRLMSSVAEIFIPSPDVILSPTRVVIPDVVAVRHERLRLVSDRGIEGAPDLVVEVLSPTSSRRDRHRKARLYARVEIPEYWIVDPRAKLVEVYALGDRGYCQDGEYRLGDRLASVTFDLEAEVASVFRW
jgi:Uma2 family endonuclease